MKVGEELLKEATLEEARVPRGTRVWLGVASDGMCHFTYATDQLAEELPAYQVESLAQSVVTNAKAVGQAIADAWTKEKMPAVNYASSGKRAVANPVPVKNVVIRGERARVIMQVNGSVSPPVRVTKQQIAGLQDIAVKAVKKLGAIVKTRKR